MLKIRPRTLLALAVLAVALLIAATFVFLRATAQIHTNPQDVPSQAHFKPSPTWADAVERGRQITRAGVVDQNLPGLSVAVGFGGNIVWAEGFGWV